MSPWISLLDQAYRSCRSKKTMCFDAEANSPNQCNTKYRQNGKESACVDIIVAEDVNRQVNITVTRVTGEYSNIGISKLLLSGNLYSWFQGQSIWTSKSNCIQSTTKDSNKFQLPKVCWIIKRCYLSTDKAQIASHRVLRSAIFPSIAMTSSGGLLSISTFPVLTVPSIDVWLAPSMDWNA